MYPTISSLLQSLKGADSREISGTKTHTTAHRLVTNLCRVPTVCPKPILSFRHIVKTQTDSLYGLVWFSFFGTELTPVVKRSINKLTNKCPRTLSVSEHCLEDEKI